MPKKMYSELGISKINFINITKSMTNLNFEDDLCKISCKTLIICGEKDIVNKRATIKINDYIKNSKIKFIKKSGHEVNIDNPNELGNNINDFYNDVN